MTRVRPQPRPARGGQFYGPGPYVEREADTTLVEALLASDYALVFAARGSGKTSLRVRTSAQLSEAGVRVATVDLGAIGAESRADAFCASLVIEAGRSLGLAEQAKTAWRRSKGPPQMRLRACVREVLLEPDDTPLVLFIDELELCAAIGPARDDFFAALRAMADARGHDPVWRRLSLCLIGAVTRDELIGDPGRSAFDLAAREFGLRDFSREQLDAFADTLAPLGVDTKALLDAIYDWTSGSPALTQWICGDLLLREIERGEEASMVEAIVRESFLAHGPEVDPLLGDTARRLRRDRRDPWRTRLLTAYERVLRGDLIDLRGRALGTDGPLIVARLRVAGLVAATAGGKLRVRNRVVERAFDRNWVRRALAGRPISDALDRWEASGRRSVQLLRGDALQRALEWIEGRPDVTAAERDFVLASERARSRRLRGLLFAGGALCVALAGTLGLVTWQYRVVAETPPPVVEIRETPPPASDDDVQAPAFVASARDVVAQATGTELRARVETLETEVAVLEQRLAIERASRAELLAPDPAQRNEGLLVALIALEAWVAGGSSLDDVPAPVTRGLTANLPSPGDTSLISAHAGAIDRLAFTADGSRFATMSNSLGGNLASGSELHVWERDTNRRVASLTSIAGPIRELALSPAGRRVAAVSDSGSLTVWSLDGDASVFGPAPIAVPEGAAMPLAPIAELGVDDGGNVNLVRRDGSYDTVDPRTSTSTRLRASELPPSLPLDHAVVIDADLGAAPRVALVHGDALQLWEVGGGRMQASVVAPQLTAGARVHSLHATPNAAELIVRFEGAAALAIWDTAQGTLRSVGAPDQAVQALALSPEGELLATAGDDRVIRIWRIDTGEQVQTIDGHAEPLTALAFTPDGARVLVGDRSGAVHVHPLALGEASLPLRSATLDAEGMAASVHFDERALELRWSGGQASARWPLARSVVEAALSLDGSRLALLHADGTLALLTGAAGPGGQALVELGPRVLDFALADIDDGKLLAVAFEDRTLSLLGADGRQLASLTGHDAPVDRVAFSPDGTRLISVDRSAVVRVWDPASAALLDTVELDGRVEQLAIAGEFFVVVDPLGHAQLWSLATDERTAQALGQFALGSEPVTGLAVAPDGSAIALGRSGRDRSAVDRGAVELWRPSSSEAPARFRAVAPVTAIRFSDDARSLLAVDGEGQLARWPTRVDDWIAEACAALGPGSVVPDICASP